MPRQWYNVIPDLPAPPPPPLHPGTGQPVGPDDLAPLFPMALIAQEVSGERHIDIPDDVLDVYRLWRPTPLFRARRLEKDLGTPARIYYKYEGGSPAGSHKPNTAVPQAYYNAAEGVTKLTTETGAGQWGSALAFAAALFGLAARGLDGAGVLRPEALPQDADGDLRRDGAPEPVRPHQRGPGGAGRAPGLHRQPGHRDQRGGRGGRGRPERPVRAGQRAEPRADAPDGHRRGGDQAAGRGRRHPGRDRRLHRRRVQLRRAGLPVPAREAGRPDQPGHPRGRAGRVPVVHPRRLRLRLRRHRGHDAAAEDAHARATSSSPTRSTPAACATTACPRCCRTSTSWA